ncbi:hypothetical protein Tco_0997749 [Tanacetum coccineum]
MVTTRRNSDDDVPNFEAMITAAVANALPNLYGSLRNSDHAKTSGRFTKLKPLAFRSAATPAEAEDWITHMEKLFQVLGCPDNFKTRLAAFKTKGDAQSWLDRENSGEYMERFTRLASLLELAAGDAQRQA